MGQFLRGDAAEPHLGYSVDAEFASVIPANATPFPVNLILESQHVGMLLRVYESGSQDCLRFFKV
jgi:hypothetical protein